MILRQISSKFTGRMSIVKESMSDKLIEEKLQEALSLHDDGKSYNEIRRHLTPELDEGTISYIIRLVDEFAIEENRIDEDIKKAKFKMYIGLAAFIVSCFLLYILYKNQALENISQQWMYSIMVLVQYFPVAFSVYFLWKAYQEELRLKKTEPEIDDSKFRLKRRNKK